MGGVLQKAHHYLISWIKNQNILLEVQLKTTLFRVISSMQQTSDWTYDSKIQSMYMYVCMSVCMYEYHQDLMWITGIIYIHLTVRRSKFVEEKWPSFNTIFIDCGNIASCQLSSSLLPRLRDCA